MKDIEKIKSEDLAAQVQDANPANFAIEQEVAQLVGATVPQPTQPSADDARELGAQLLVFLRRALLPIRSALRTAVAAIYAHLDSRCTDYTPAAYAPFTPTHHAYDPMGSTPRTLPNLLTALTAFSARKISNGSATADGIPDGVSLAHLISDYTGVTKLIDDNSGWVYAASFSTSGFEDRLTKVFPNLSYVELGCSRNSSPIFLQNDQLTKIVFRELVTMDYEPFWVNDYNGGFNNLTEIEFPKLETGCALVAWNLSGWWNNGLMGVSRITFPKMKRIKNGQRTVSRTALFSGKCPSITALEFPELTTMDASMWGGNTLPSLVSLKMPKLTHCNVQFMQGGTGGTPYYGSSADLIDIEVGELQTNFDIRGWNPTNVLSDADKTATFLQNFKEHIALRLTANGSGKTLTLSQAVFDTIWNADGTPKSTDPDSVIYQINKIIKTDKHWSVNRA